MNAVNIVSHGRELYQILVGTFRAGDVQRVYIVLGISSHEGGVLLDLKRVRVLGRHLVTVSVSPGSKVVAEILRSRHGNGGSLVKLVAYRVARHLTSALGTQLDIHSISRNGLQFTFYIACDDNITEGILLVIGQIVNIDFHVEDVVGGRNAAQVESVVRHVGRFLCQLRCNALAHLCRLFTADNDNVELTAVSTYTAGIEREALGRECQGLLGLQGKYNRMVVITGFTCLGRLELLAGDASICAQAGSRQFVAP